MILKVFTVKIKILTRVCLKGAVNYVLKKGEVKYSKFIE
jgi:hypothetical protein